MRTGFFRSSGKGGPRASPPHAGRGESTVRPFLGPCAKTRSAHPGVVSQSTGGCGDHHPQHEHHVAGGLLAITKRWKKIRASQRARRNDFRPAR